MSPHDAASPPTSPNLSALKGGEGFNPIAASNFGPSGADRALVAANRRRRRGVHPVAWEAVGMYWHFVDAVWVVVFSVVYLGTLL